MSSGLADDFTCRVLVVSFRAAEPSPRGHAFRLTTPASDPSLAYLTFYS